MKAGVNTLDEARMKGRWTKTAPVPEATRPALTSVAQDVDSTAAELRQRAEKRAERAPKNTKLPSPAALRRTLHELQVYQIELELQNDELRRARDELDAVRERYFDLYDLAPVGYVTVSEQGLIVEANLTAATLLGLTRDTLVKQPASRFIVKEDAAVYASFRKWLFETREAQACELRMLKKDGSPFWAHLAATAAEAPGGATVYRIALSDITVQKRTEAELQKMQTLQMVGMFAGGIAHDFNNILLRLFGNIFMAMDDLSKEHPSYALLEAAVRSKSHALRLTNQLLTFAKGGAPVKEDVELKTLVEDVALFNLSGSNVGLFCRQAEDQWPAQADKGQLQQVVANLVINARQAMPDGGHLYIALENADLPETAFPGLRAGRYVKITLRDKGVGIDPSLLDRIFDPYFTTKQTGSGLGLATVWSVINRHGGHIGVVSEKGKGTTFTIHLPASKSGRPAKMRPAAIVHPAPARPTRILVMDDDEDVLTLTMRMLTRCGFIVSTAPGGREAVALYRQALEAGEPFAAVIMDLTIPGGFGGKQAVRELLSFDPFVRTIVSSGYSEDPVMADPTSYGFKDSIPKPYTQNEISEVVARVLK